MDEDELLLILSPYRYEKKEYDWSDPEIRYRFGEKDIPKIMDGISKSWREAVVERAELRAKVKAYEAILENSNFKMAVVRKKKEAK